MTNHSNSLNDLWKVVKWNRMASVFMISPSICRILSQCWVLSSKDWEHALYLWLEMPTQEVNKKAWNFFLFIKLTDDGVPNYTLSYRNVIVVKFYPQDFFIPEELTVNHVITSSSRLLDYSLDKERKGNNKIAQGEDFCHPAWCPKYDLQESWGRSQPPFASCSLMFMQALEHAHVCSHVHTDTYINIT